MARLIVKPFSSAKCFWDFWIGGAVPLFHHFSKYDVIVLFEFKNENAFN